MNNDTVTIRRDDFQVIFEYSAIRGNRLTAACASRAMRHAIRTNSILKTEREKDIATIVAGLRKYQDTKRLGYQIINKLHGEALKVSGSINNNLASPVEAVVVGPVWILSEVGSGQVKEKGLVMMEVSNQDFVGYEVDSEVYGDGTVHYKDGSVGFRFPVHVEQIIIPEHLKHKLTQ